MLFETTLENWQFLFWKKSKLFESLSKTRVSAQYKWFIVQRQSQSFQLFYTTMLYFASEVWFLQVNTVAPSI